MYSTVIYLFIDIVSFLFSWQGALLLIIILSPTGAILVMRYTPETKEVNKAEERLRANKKSADEVKLGGLKK